MKKILLLTTLVLVSIVGVTQNIEKKYVSVGEPGWKRVAYSTNNVGRGYSKVTLLTYGGANAPYVTEIGWFKGWSDYGSINIISNSRSAYWNNSRITFDGVKSYLEVYFTYAIPSLLVSLDKTVWDQAQIIEGNLPEGGGTVIASAEIERVNFGENDFILTYTGNVAIGACDPVDKFVVHQLSNEHWAGFIKNGGGAGKGLLLRSGAGSDVPVLQVEDNYQNMRFLVKSNGEVGIGVTDTQGNKLAVAGNAAIDGILKAKEVKVQTNVWADFVFDEDYNLRSLNDLESYIREYKHLPEIPNADEVKKEGISVGEMNAKLLQKIEELTLYVIEQQKEIVQLKAKEEKIDRLEEAIQSLMNKKNTPR